MDYADLSDREKRLTESVANLRIACLLLSIPAAYGTYQYVLFVWAAIQASPALS